MPALFGSPPQGKTGGLGGLGGFTNAIQQFNAQNPGALVALGAGIMNRNPAAGFAAAAPIAAQGQRNNATAQYLLAKGIAKSPEEAMALAGQPELLRIAIKNPDEYSQRAEAATRYGLKPTDPNYQSFVLGMKGTGDNPETFYGQPLFTEDAQGVTHANQLGNRGTFKPIDLGGNKLVSSTKQINTPTEVITTDRFGNELFRTPKDNRQASADRAIGAGEGTQAVAAPTDIMAGRQALETLDGLRVDPNRERGTGMSSVFNGIPATGGLDFQTKVDQAKAGAFMTAIQQMRGMGSLSDAEGATARAAVTSMSTSTSEGEFLAALDRYQTIIERGMAKAQARQQQYGTAIPGVSDAATIPAGGGAEDPLGIR